MGIVSANTDKSVGWNIPTDTPFGFIKYYITYFFLTYK